jgi:hypothetical protein
MPFRILETSVGILETAQTSSCENRQPSLCRESTCRAWYPREAAASVQRDSADLPPHSQPNSKFCALETVVSIFRMKSLTPNFCFVMLLTLIAKNALLCICCNFVSPFA